MATVQFSILPSFSTLVLPDNSPILDAVSYILLTLRASPTTPAHTLDSCKNYSSSICAQMNVQSVGELRTLTDSDFKALQIPAILRIYLKHLVRGTQSGRKVAAAPSGNSNNAASPTTAAGANSDPFLTALQNDFNHGQPFDMSLYRSHMDTLALMGFSGNQSLEALCIVENKSVEAACELLLSTDAAQRKEKRARVVERLGRQGGNSRSEQQHQQQQVVEQREDVRDGAMILALQSELNFARNQMVKERSARLTQSAEYKSFIETTLPLKIYSEYLKSLLVKEYILPVELEQLNKYRERNHIDAKSHVSTLMELGIDSPANLESLIRKNDRNKSVAPGQGGNQQQPGDMDCVVCLDKPKNHIIMNCMHLCLCEDCANGWLKNKGPQNSFKMNCPICSKKITQIAKIYV